LSKDLENLGQCHRAENRPTHTTPKNRA